MKTVTMRRDVT